MEWLERPLGPLRIRAWGLVLNLFANALALFGLSRVLADGTGTGLLAAGGGASVVLIAVLAVPAR